MKRCSYILVWLVAIVAIACALLGYEKDLLWKVQELNLFLNTHLFFKQQILRYLLKNVVYRSMMYKRVDFQSFQRIMRLT